MAGSAVNISMSIMDRQIREQLEKMQLRLGHLQPALKIIGDIVEDSVEENFAKGGRPQKWQRLAPATEAKKKGGSILVDQGYHGGLLGSIHSEVGHNSVMVGTDKKYGAIHQFGGKAGRNKKVTIPAREYLLVQDEDWVEILAELNDYIMLRKI
jgi:phage virion morphogenesis protein